MNKNPINYEYIPTDVCIYVLELLFQENKETMKDKQRAQKIRETLPSCLYIFVDTFQCVEKKTTS